MIHYINLFFIVFNLVLLFFLLKKGEKKRIQEQFFNTTPSNTKPIQNSEDAGCALAVAECNYDETEQTESRTECVNNCKLVKGCDSLKCSYRCFDKKCSRWTSSSCSWEPYGNTITNCTKMCIEKKGCNYTKCYKICSDCESEKDCAWYKQKVNEEDIFIKENLPVNIDPTRPLPPTIFVSVKRDGIVNIKFNPPFTIKPQPTATNPIIPTAEIDTTTNPTATNPIIPTAEIDTTTLDTTINSFMYVIYKTQDKTGGIRVGTYTPDKSITTKIKDYNKKPSVLPIIEFDIENLDKNTFYNIGIRSYRDTDQKISPLSNIFTVIPNKEKKHSVPKLVIADSKTGQSHHFKPQVCPSVSP